MDMRTISSAVPQAAQDVAAAGPPEVVIGPAGATPVATTPSNKSR